MVTHACGHSMYRTMDGTYICPRCAKRDDICPRCDGDGFILRGRRMSKCTTCEGTGTRVAPTDGKYNEVVKVSSSSAVSGSGRDYDSPVAASSWTGPRCEFDSTQTGGRWCE